MLRQLSREVESDSSLDFPARDRVLLVVVSQSGSFSGNSFEYVIDKRVHDAHGLGGDTSVRVDLLQDFVDVDGIALLARLSSGLLLSSGLALHGSSLLLSLLGCDFSRHCCGSTFAVDEKILLFVCRCVKVACYRIYVSSGRSLCKDQMYNYQSTSRTSVFQCSRVA